MPTENVIDMPQIFVIGDDIHNEATNNMQFQAISLS